MKKIKSLFVSAAILIASVSQAQTADDIVNKYVEAIGGKEKISQLKSIYTETSMDAMGNSSTAFEYLLEGKGYKTESDFNGMKIINCYTDKGGWQLTRWRVAPMRRQCRMRHIKPVRTRFISVAHWLIMRQKVIK